MSVFDASTYLRQATSRAKSDVANKMVSMFLHQLSRVAVERHGMAVTDARYCQAVVDTFGQCCLYCGQPLETNRAAVEHLEGMNRFRIGLHVPGNVAISCVSCNREKRRDDQRPELSLASSGWESFLSHDGRLCGPDCKSCAYWQARLADATERTRFLENARARIHEFRGRYAEFTDYVNAHREVLKAQIEVLYRHSQNFAHDEITARLADAGRALGW